jgi:aldehyde reductase
VINQVECHPYLGQAKLKKFCEDRGIFMTAYSPLGSPDRPWARPEDPKLLDDPKIVELAKKYEKSAAQIVLRWQIQRGCVVIPKSVTPSRIEENSKLFDFNLTNEDMATINSFECNGRVINVLVDGKSRDAAHPHFPFHIEF